MNTTWVLDLDNTLYPAASGLFALVDLRIRTYMEQRAGIAPEQIPALRDRYKREYGVTLGGLLAHHHVDPYDYLEYVHDLPLGEFLRPDPAVRDALLGLDSRRVVFTNGSRGHAENVLGHLGLSDLMDRIFDIEFMEFVPKPFPQGYQRMLRSLGARAEDCCMVDDQAVNLDTARDLGMQTVLVGPPAAGNSHRRVESLTMLARLAAQ